MKKIFQLAAILSAGLLLAVSCSQNEYDTDQYDNDAVVLQAYGPQPVVRGGQLRFLGSNLEKVVSVTIPADNVITDIEVVASGKHSEIRVTVPKETAAPGYPVLTLADGTTLSGKTLLSYAEPISIDSVEPAEVLPGAEITIRGDYLNLIHEVIFAENVKVSETAFTAHDRYQIRLAVPEEARSGKIGLGTLDENALSDEDAATLLASLNIVESSEPIVVLTAEGALAQEQVKAGEELVINGKHLQLVRNVSLTGASVEEFTASDTRLSFPLPAKATDGEVLLVMASGVEVSAGSLTTVVPTDLGIAPAPVKNGAQLGISGKDLDLVTGVELPNAGWVEFENDGQIRLTVPETAQEGEVLLHLENGKSVAVAYTLVKPVVKEFSANPASAGSDLILSGTDLDLVAAVTFGGGAKVDVEASETEITVGVPTAAETGALTLNLKNGASVTTEELVIDKPAGAYIPVVPEDVFSPGDMLIVDIENADRLTDVQINGESVTYIVSGSTLYVQIPANAGVGTTISLISNEGTVTYTLNIDPGDMVMVTVWEGPSGHTGDYAANQELGGEDDWVNAGLQEGDEIRIYFVPDDPSDWSIQVFDGHWGSLSYVTPSEGQWNVQNTPDGAAQGYVSFQATGDAFTALTTHAWWGSALILQGKNLVFTKLVYVHYFKQENTIWEGSEHIAWSGMTALSWGGYDWSSVSAGTVLTAYYTLDADQDYWQMRFGNGSWATLPSGLIYESGEGNIPLEAGSTRFSLTLTQDDIDMLTGSGGLVMTGTNYTLTKLTLL